MEPTAIVIEPTSMNVPEVDKELLSKEFRKMTEKGGVFVIPQGYRLAAVVNLKGC